MNNIKNKNSRFHILILMISLIFIHVIIYLSRNCTLFGDDLSYGLYSAGIFDTLNPFSEVSAFSVHGGGYLCLFLTNFFNFHLPYMLNIHPNDFISVPHGVIKGIFYCLVLLSISNFSQLFKKSKLIYCLFYIFLFCYSVSLIIELDSFIISTNHAFYRYFFPLIFFSFFWSFIFQNIIFLDIKQNNLKLFLASVCGFIIGTSVEILFLFSALLALFVIIYNLVPQSVYRKFFPGQFKKFNLNKNFYIPVCCLFFGLTAYMFSAGFQSITGMRGINDGILNLSYLKEFCITFFQNYIFPDLILWIIFIIIAAGSFYFELKKNTPEKILFPLMMLFSIFIVMFSLVLCGKTYYEEGKFWLSHPNIHVLYSILIIYPFLIFYSSFSGYFSLLGRNEKVIKTIIILMLISASVYKIYYTYENIPYSYCYNDTGLMAMVRKNNYIAEKIYRFYYLQNKKPYLPSELNSMGESNIRYALWYRYCNINNKCCDSSIFNLTYYPRLYKNEKARIQPYCFIDDGYNKFYSLGGHFEKEELDNIKFQKLYDKNFVLSCPKKISR